MSDSRCYLDIKFSIYGKDYEWKASINYSPGYVDDMDDRILEWFQSCYRKAHGEWMEEIEADNRHRQAEEAERRERAEYERLKAKFG